MLNKIYEKIKDFIVANYKFLLFMIIFIVIARYDLPYMIYKSGGTIDLNDRIETSLNYESEGTLSMSYVNVIRGSIPFILLSYVIPDWDLKPVEEDYSKIINVSKEYMNEGIDNAIIAAFRVSDYTIDIKGEYVVVIDTIKNSNSDLKTGDRLLSINDYKVTNLEDTKNYINSLKPGDKVEVKVINDNKKYTRHATLIDENGETKIGIYLNTRYEYKTEIPVDVKMKKDESGSSGGLMMALSIYDSLTKEDITNGLNIVGTGTIDADGNVGEIDGVKYKLLAASKKKADIFFVPPENYKEAMKVKNKRNLDITVVEVKTLRDAINYLENL